jgi:hypothetical protein
LRRPSIGGGTAFDASAGAVGVADSDIAAACAGKVITDADAMDAVTAAAV